MQNNDHQAQLARQLLAGEFHGVLSTQSVEHLGYPFGSVIPYALGQDGLPLLLLSHLSQHTRNLTADPRCSLTVLQTGDGNVQERARLCGVGEVQPLAEQDEGARYFDYYPQSREYFAHLNFRFYRFMPLRFHWNGGFATARWFGNDRLIRRNPLSIETQHQVTAHMNQEHLEALRRCLGKRHGRAATGPLQMVGIDAEGIDVRAADQLYRIPLLHPIATLEEARRVLVEMATREC